MKRLKYFIYFIVLSLLLIGKVEAETCPLEQRTALGAVAANVNVTYEESIGKEIDEDYGDVYYSVYYLDVKIYNITPDIKIKVTNDMYDDIHYITYEDMDHDGIVTLRAADLSYKITYTFEIFGNNEDCELKKFRTIKLTLPKYNYFSHYEICSEIPEFYMCQRYILNEFDGANFQKAATEYRDKKLAQENEKNEDGEIKDNTSSVSKIAKKVSDNKLLVSGIIIGIGVIVTIVILIKKKRSVL